jgi:hypothetical protein
LVPRDARQALGHRLAVRKYIERIVSLKKQTSGTTRTERERFHSLSQVLHAQLVKELREFCNRLTELPLAGAEEPAQLS